MALSLQSLKRHGTQPAVGSTAGTPNLNQISSFVYATDDAAAVVEAAGYFNAARGLMTVGSIIQAVMAIGGGTPVHKNYVVTAVPNSGNVTIAIQTVTAG